MSIIKKKCNEKMAIRLEQRNFHIENTQMANRHTKKCTTSLVMREIQIKTTKRCLPIYTQWNGKN